MRNKFIENKKGKYAKNLIEKSGNDIEKAMEIFKGYLPIFSNVIALCQQSIELSAKAVFKLMGMDFPKNHEIRFELKGTKELLKKDFPKTFQEKDKIPRLIFLTQFWKRFYELAKYGKEKLNIGPDDLFGREEAEIALKHAKECYRIAENLEIIKRFSKL